MDKLLILMVLLTIPAMSRGDQYTILKADVYRNGYGDNSVDITARLDRLDLGTSTWLDGSKVCGLLPGNKMICGSDDLRSDRIGRGDTVSMLVNLGRTKYPISKVIIRK